MDKQQKKALILLPILAIAILAGGMFMSGKTNTASAATYTDGVYEGEGEGFGGTIKVKVEVAGGKITSIELVEHGETPGIGDVGLDDVIGRIIAEQKLDVDVSSGATFSSNGVMEAVTKALAGAMPQSFTDGEFEGEGQGFGGPLKVKVVVKDGKIASIELLDNSETPGIGDKGAEDIIGRIIEEQKIDVDVSTGASGSSKGIIEAVKNALGLGTDKVEETEEEVVEEIEFIDGVYEGAAEGFHGDIKVKVEVKDGKLTKVEVLEHGETPGIGDIALEELPALMVKDQTVAVDGKSGATYSSKGIKAAVINALKSESLVAGADKPATVLKDGTYVGKDEGFHGDIELQVTVKDGKVTKIDIVSMDETPGIGDVAVEELVANALAKQSPDVDAISTASFSSKATISALKQAFDQAK